MSIYNEACALQALSASIELQSRRHFTERLQVMGYIVHADERVRMVWAEHALLDSESASMEQQSRRRVTERPQAMG